LIIPMKRYDDLTPDQQESAIRDTLKTLIKGLMEGTMGVHLKHDMHNRMMRRMLDHGRESGDFTRFHRFTRKSTVFKEDIGRIAKGCAEKAYYTQPNEYVVYGVAE
jgi:hypothetical protein